MNVGWNMGIVLEIRDGNDDNQKPRGDDDNNKDTYNIDQ
jgi:hypothetical protein